MKTQMRLVQISSQFGHASGGTVQLRLKYGKKTVKHGSLFSYDTLGILIHRQHIQIRVSDITNHKQHMQMRRPDITESVHMWFFLFFQFRIG